MNLAPQPPPPLTPPPEFLEDCSRAGMSLTDPQLEALGLFLALLLDANKRFNLTAIREPAQAWRRHILESLSLRRFLGPGRALDLGSGGGLPGVPLAIVCEEVEMTLLEATGKKARFLEDAAEALGLARLRVVCGRAETVGHKSGQRESYEAVLARAVGPMNVLAELAMPFVKPGGRLLALKGKRVEDELASAGDALLALGAGEVTLHEALPGLEDEAVIVEVVKEHPTPRRFPRLPGTPKSHPL